MELDIEWAKEQLALYKPKKAVGDAVMHLLTTFTSISQPAKSNISSEVVSIFSKLASGIPLVVEEAIEGVWGPARAGDIKVTDVVRVKSDAYDLASGKYPLNGRVGKVVGVRSGDIIVKTTDTKLPVLDGQHFSIPSLEKLYK